MAQKKTAASAKHDRPDQGRGEETILLALVLIEPLLFTPWTRDPFVAKDLFFAAALLALALARLVAVRSGRVPGRVPISSAVALGVVVALNLALTGVSRHPGVSLTYAVRLLGYGSLFLLVASRSWDGVFFRRFAAMILAGTITASLYGMLQVAQLDPVSWTDTFRVAGAPLESMRMFSTFGHPNFFGSHLAMALFFAGAAALLTRTALQRAAAAGGMLLGLPCLLLTLNRGAWVGFLSAAVAVAALVWLAKRRGVPSPGAAAVGAFGARALAVVAGLSLIAALLAVVGSSSLRQRLDLGAGLAEPTVASRLLIWSGAMKMIGEHPILGSGPGTFGAVFPFYRDARLADYHDELTPVTHAHNEYLEIAAETGIPGFLAFTFFVAAALRSGWIKLRGARSGQERIVPGALLAGAVSILVAGLFGVELRYVNTSIFLWVILGFMAAEPPQVVRPGQGAAARFAALTPALACIGALALLVVTVRVFVGEALLNRAEASLAAGLPGQAAGEGRAARAWNPTDPAGLMLAAEALVAVKDYAGARELYREVRRINPAEPLVGYDLALTEHLLGNFDESLREVEVARRLYPRHAPTHQLQYDIWLKIGLERVRRGDLAGAKQAFVEARGVKTHDPRAIFYLGNVYATEGRYEAAIDRYRRALGKDPTFAPAAENMKRIMAIQGR